MVYACHWRIGRMVLGLTLCASLACANGDDDAARFRQLVKQATTAYGTGDLRKSIALLREAYALEADPRLLHNMAKIEEGLGRLPEALALYRDFLAKSPDAANRDVVAGRITVIEEQIGLRRQQEIVAQRLRAQKAESAGDRKEAIAQYERYLELAPKAEDRTAVEAKLTELRRPAQSDSTPKRLKAAEPPSSIAPWLVTGVGVAAMTTGAVFSLLSRGKYDDARSAKTGRETDDLRRTGDSFATVGGVALIAGGIVTAGGLTWVLLDAGSGGKERSALRLVVAPAAVTLGGTL